MVDSAESPQVPSSAGRHLRADTDAAGRAAVDGQTPVLVAEHSCGGGTTERQPPHGAASRQLSVHTLADRNLAWSAVDGWPQPETAGHTKKPLDHETAGQGASMRALASAPGRIRTCAPASGACSAK